MKCYFLTNKENVFFVFLVPFHFHFFQFLQFWKKNFCGTFTRATSLYIRKTVREPQKTGSRANTLATPALDVTPHLRQMSQVVVASSTYWTYWGSI